MKQFDKVGLVKQAWELVKKNLKLFAILVGIFVAFHLVQSLVVKQLGPSLLASVVSLLFSLLNIFLEVGFIKIVLNLVDGKAATFQQLWASPQYFLRALVISILMVVAFVVGFILLIVPGVYLALRLQFSVYYLVDKNTGVMESIKGSWNMTRGNVMNLFLFALLIIALNILGAIVLLVGLLVTIPVSLVAIALSYRKLQA